jgi:hypothetical protein
VIKPLVATSLSLARISDSYDKILQLAYGITMLMFRLSEAKPSF